MQHEPNVCCGRRLHCASSSAPQTASLRSLSSSSSRWSHCHRRCWCWAHQHQCPYCTTCSADLQLLQLLSSVQASQYWLLSVACLLRHMIGTQLTKIRMPVHECCMTRQPPWSASMTMQDMHGHRLACPRASGASNGVTCFMCPGRPDSQQPRFPHRLPHHQHQCLQTSGCQSVIWS